MKKIIYIVLIALSFSCVAQDAPKQFSEKALNETVLQLDDTPIAIKSLIEKHKGKTVLIDVWASWCKDCVAGMPKVNALQINYPEVVYVFLSLDRSVKSWKKGIEKYNVEGEHYFVNSGFKGDFASFLDVDWIPRYLVIDKDGSIKLFKATDANDTKIKEAIE